MNYENLEAYEFQPEIANEFEYEMYEAELAQELLSLENEAELNHFLGGLIKGGLSVARGLLGSSAGQAIKGQLISGAKSLGRRVLPSMGRRAGGWLGRKAGGWLGGKLGGAAGQQAGADAFGQAGSWLGGAAGDWAANRYLNEYEGEAPANAGAELSVARGILRMIRQASMEIAALAQSGQPLNRGSVRAALLRNARQQFPQVNFGAPPRTAGPRPAAPQSEYGYEYEMDGGDGAGAYGQTSGSWYRQGNQIILSGV